MIKHIIFLLFVGILGCKSVPVSSTCANNTYLDLSNKKLISQPDLSACFLIDSLDLSHNQIDTIMFSKLPPNLKYLKATNSNVLWISASTLNKPSTLSKIIIDSNRLERIGWLAMDNLTYLSCANNQLKSFAIADQNLSYLDISNNTELKTTAIEMCFNKIDKKAIIRDNIADTLPLKHIGIFDGIVSDDCQKVTHIN